MTPDNIHFLIATGFFSLVVAAIAVTSVLNTRARRQADTACAQARAREAYWRRAAEAVSDTAGDAPGQEEEDRELPRPAG